MSTLRMIDSFAGGLSQGVGRGMTLYSQYSDQQEKNKQRQKAAAIEAQIGTMSQAGELNDPIEGANKLSQMYMAQGMPDEAQKYYAQAEAARSAKADKHMLNSYSLAKIGNVEGSVAEANEFAKVKGLGFTMGVVRTADGFQVDYQGPDGKNSKQYTDTEKYGYDNMQFFAPFMEGAKDIRKNDAEINKNEAAASNYEQSALTEAATRPARVDQLEASAGASRASAAASYADTRREDAAAPLNKEYVQSQINRNNRVDAAEDPTKDILGIYEGMGVVPQDPYAPSTGPLAPDRDPMVLAPIAAGIAKNGLDLGSSASLAIRLVGLPGAKVNVKTGMVREPDGTMHNVGVTAARDLERQINAASDARKAAPQ